MRRRLPPLSGGAALVVAGVGLLARGDECARVSIERSGSQCWTAEHWRVAAVSGLHLSGTSMGLTEVGIGLVVIGLAGWSLSRDM